MEVRFRGEGGLPGLSNPVFWSLRVRKVLYKKKDNNDNDYLIIENHLLERYANLKRYLQYIDA